MYTLVANCLRKVLQIIALNFWLRTFISATELKTGFGWMHKGCTLDILLRHMYYYVN